MGYIAIIVIAYFLTGIWRIRRDFSQDFHNRPAYARNPSRYFKGFTLVILTWPVIVYHEVRIHRSLGKALVPCITFGLFIAFGLWISS